MSDSFKVYWNIPSFMCKKYTDFTNLPASYGIQQNSKDAFRGEKVVILYDPGSFPAYLKNGTQEMARNGGVPQKGDLEDHLKEYIKALNEQIPDPNFDGLAVIDFESWRPIFRQNWGVLTIYKERSLEIQKKLHPKATPKELNDEVTKLFENAGRKFVEKTILLSKDMRPKAKWGYYAFPYCFNSKGESCASECVQSENDRMIWMFEASDVILPSVYMQESTSADIRIKVVDGRINEAMRISRLVKNRPVYVYIRYLYCDTLKLLSKEDMLHVFTAAKAQGAAGIILWGSSNDLKTEERSKELKDYLNNILGPISKRFIGP